MKDYLLVNWNDYKEKGKGGVQCVFKNVGNILSDKYNIRQVSFKNSVSAIDPLRINQHINSEISKSLVIDRYVEHYLNLWGDIVHGMVRNAGCGGLTNFSDKVNIVNIFNDPYHSIYENLVSSGYTGNKDELWRFRRTAVLLQKECGLQGKNVAVSDFMKQDMLNNGIKCDDVVVNALDWDFWKPITDYPKIYVGKKKYKSVGLWVGCIHPIKNFHNVRKLVKDFPDIFWILVVKGGVDQYVDRPRFSNFMIYSDISSDLLKVLYMNADFVFCASSVESFNLVALEASLMNKPVIASKSGFYWNNVYWNDKLGIRLDYWDDYDQIKESVDVISKSLDSSPFSPRSHITLFPEFNIVNWNVKMKKVLNY